MASRPAPSSTIHKGHPAVAIPLAAGTVAFVDPEDYDRVRQFAWFERKTERNTNYVIARIGGRAVLLHRFVLGLPGSVPHVDHEDRNGLNCCKWNLRVATRSQNGANSAKQAGPRTSRYKGVWKFRDRWRAAICVEGKRRYLGVFDTEEGAARAYDAAAVAAFGSSLA